jgi:hypothetical protein
MQRNEFAPFAAQIMALGELYKVAVSEYLVEMYWNMLEDYEFKDIKRALYEHGKNPDQGKFMPKPADIVKLLEGGSKDKAMQAWSKVHQAIQRIGRYQSVVFDDPIIHAVISDMDGWIKLCDVTDKELPFKAREFEQRYAAYLLKPPEEHPKQLTGIVDQHNSAHGHEEHIPDAQLIGDSKKALEVAEKGSEQTFTFQRLMDVVKRQQAQALADATSAQAITANYEQPPDSSCNEAVNSLPVLNKKPSALEINL